MSASTSGRRPKPKGRIKVGICENHNYTDPRTGQTGDCPKCASGERMKVEVQRLSDFRCPVCGERLTPVKERKWMLWVGIAAVIAAICAVCCWWIPKGCTSGGGIIDTIDTVDTVVEEPPVIGPTDPTGPIGGKDTCNPGGGRTQIDPLPEEPEKQEIVLDGAAVIMTYNDGYKYLKFKQDYDISRGALDDEVVSVKAGDELWDIIIKDNCITEGQLYRNHQALEYLNPIMIHL